MPCGAERSWKCVVARLACVAAIVEVRGRASRLRVSVRRVRCATRRRRNEDIFARSAVKVRRSFMVNCTHDSDHQQAYQRPYDALAHLRTGIVTVLLLVLVVQACMRLCHKIVPKGR